MTELYQLINYNTFASQRLVFEEKNKLFLLENASNLLKLLNKISCVKLHAFSRINGSLFFLKNEALRSESINEYTKLQHRLNSLQRKNY